jgi:hypothetical protein
MASNDTYQEKLRQLEKQVGDGVLRGELVVNQAYAAKQHVTQHYHHPRGGGPNFVSGPLMRSHRGWYRQLARNVLHGDLSREMKDIVDEWARQAAQAAPIEDGPLRGSMSPRVYDDGKQTYHRPPAVPRLPDYQRNYRPGWQWNRENGRPGWPQ